MAFRRGWFVIAGVGAAIVCAVALGASSYAAGSAKVQANSGVNPQLARPIPPPLHPSTVAPSLTQQVEPAPLPQTSRPSGFAPVTSGTWTALKNQPPIGPGSVFLLTDGTVMAQDGGAADWWKLTPDNTGSYVNGTWSQAASMGNCGGSAYAPLYYGSAVLPDGRLVVIGGEYNNYSSVWTNQGAIYDPIANKWTCVAPPSGWSQIGDAESIVLPDRNLYDRAGGRLSSRHVKRRRESPNFQ